MCAGVPWELGDGASAAGGGLGDAGEGAVGAEGGC